jgi:hypothetical protein
MEFPSEKKKWRKLCIMRYAQWCSFPSFFPRWILPSTNKKINSFLKSNIISDNVLLKQKIDNDFCLVGPYVKVRPGVAFVLVSWKVTLIFKLCYLMKRTCTKIFSLVRKLRQTKLTQLVTLFDETGSGLIPPVI